MYLKIVVCHANGNELLNHVWVVYRLMDPQSNQKPVKLSPMLVAVKMGRMEKMDKMEKMVMME